MPQARFSALQRAEIAEMNADRIVTTIRPNRVSVLFNEPKLLKYHKQRNAVKSLRGFSALQRAEIAEIVYGGDD